MLFYIANFSLLSPGKYNQAAPLYEKALEIRSECFGGLAHPSIAEIKNNLAMLNFAQGE